MNIKDGLYSAFIAMVTSCVLWGLNYFFIEKPKMNLEESRLKLENDRVKLDTIREEINQKDREINLRERQIRFIQEGIFRVKVENIECRRLNHSTTNNSIWYECYFLNKSIRPIFTYLSKENFSLEQFSNGRFNNYYQNDKFLFIDEISNANNIAPDSLGMIRFRISTKDQRYKISDFISKQQVIVSLPFSLDKQYITTAKNDNPYISGYIDRDSKILISLRLQ